MVNKNKLKWLPDIISLDDFTGNSEVYLQKLLEVFKKDFIESQPTFKKGVVFVDTTDENGKPKSFLHLTSGDTGNSLDIRRSERICWIRPIIENFKEKEIFIWENERPRKKGSRQKRICILYEKEKFIIILTTKKNNNHFLLTAYHIEGDHSFRKKIKERDAFYNQKTPQ